MTAGAASRLLGTRIYLIATPPPGARTPASACGEAWLERVTRIGRSGVRMIQLRQKDGSTDSRRSWLAALRAALPPDTLLIVNDDLDAFSEPGGSPLADGVHVGREDARVLGGGELVRGLRRARERIGAEALLGSSTRSLAEVRAALEGGVDHVGFGAMAASPTKTGSTRADPAELARCAAAFPALPIFPIGGLSEANLHLLSGLPTRRAALGSALLEAADPEAATREVLAWARGG